MNKAISIFIEEAVIVERHFPDLKLFQPENEIPYIEGTLLLNDESGITIDRYIIKITPSDNYPTRFPIVYEIENRIPKNIHWHIYPSSGNCCIASLPDEILFCRQGLDLFAFIKDYVTPYFFNQKFREVHGYFLNERSHGALGNLEFFIDILKTADLRAIYLYLSFIKRRKEPDRRNLCFCGNGKKYRKCHREIYRKLKVFTNSELDHFMSLCSKVITSAN